MSFFTIQFRNIYCNDMVSHHCQTQNVCFIIQSHRSQTTQKNVIVNIRLITDHEVHYSLVIDVYHI